MRAIRRKPILQPDIWTWVEGLKIAFEVITFGGEKQPSPEEARAAVIPVPWEATVSYGRGTSLGPAAVMCASGHMELYEPDLGMEPYKLGILTLPAVDVSGPAERVLARIADVVSTQIAAGRLPAVLGGEHTVTLGALKAMVRHYGLGFTVMVLDAHLDLREEFEGSGYSHACVMKRALDMGLSVRQVGIRSCSVEEAKLVKERGLCPVWAWEADQDGQWIEKSLQGVSGPVYVSLDVDGLDPSCMPATGTPEPGGLSWYQVNRWLAEICRRHQVLGLDLVELAPLSQQPAWDFTAARLLYRALGLALQSGRPRSGRD